MSEAPTEVVVGLRFRHAIADERPLWEVLEFIGRDSRRGRAYWVCRVIEPDFDGHEDAFEELEILACFRLAEIFGGYDPANYVPSHDASG